jgi:hypothetical protein
LKTLSQETAGNELWEERHEFLSNENLNGEGVRECSNKIFILALRNQGQWIKLNCTPGVYVWCLVQQGLLKHNKLLMYNVNHQPYIP